jgi:hypothetical protein
VFIANVGQTLELAGDSLISQLYTAFKNNLPENYISMSLLLFINITHVS